MQITRRATIALALALALIVGGSAFAADLPSRRAPTPYVAPVSLMTWTSFHIGVNAGATFGGRSTATTIGLPVYTNTATAVAVAPFQALLDTAFTKYVGTGSRTGAVLGVQAGYDFQFSPSFLAGIEADVQGVIGPSGRGSASIVLPAATPGGFATGNLISTTTVTQRLDWLGTVRGRFGFVATPAFLLYATGGLAYGGVKSSSLTSASVVGSANGAAFPISGAFGAYSTNRVGYTAGAGGEYMFMPNFSLKAEYLYYNLGSTTYNGGLSNFTSLAGLGLLSQEAVRTRVRFDGHIARIGVNYHFWSPVAAPVVARY